MEDRNMNMIIEARSTHVYRGGGPNHKEDMSRLCAMEVKSTRSTGEPSRKRRGKEHHKVRYVGVPIIVLESRQTQHEAKSGAQVGGTAFVLGVFTTNHVRNKVNLEVK